MKQINIREALLELDRKTDARYDLTTLYEACKLDDDDKQQLVKYIDAYDHPATINKFLSSKCDAITEALGDDDVSDMKVIDEINDGGDRTLWSLMNKFEDEDLQLKDLTEDVDPEVLEGRLENINFVMNNYVKDSFLIDDVQGSGKDWKVTYNDVTVDVNFDTDWEEYTYYINGKGPYAHSSYEYIASDIANFVDYNHLGQSDDEVDEALGDNRDVHSRTHMDSYDVYCTDCGQVTSHKFKGNFKDGEKELGRYICKECGCENDDDPINESLTEGALDENPIIAWLGEHEQAWEDFTAHFVGRDISELSDDEIIGWISEHDQLYADYKNYFKVDECLNEGVDTSNLEPQIKEVVTAVMQENGYEADEIEAYTAVEIKDTADDMVQVEVRAELGYDDLMELCDKLNPIVAAVDPHAYFEPVTSGIARAFIRNDQSQDIVDEEAVNQWTNKIYDCASMEDLRQVWTAFKDHIDNGQYTDGTVDAVLDEIHKKADMLNESLTEATSDSNLDLIKHIQQAVKSRGRLTVNDTGVRYVSLEDDFATFVSRDAFDRWLQQCVDKEISLADIDADDIPWEHTIFVHHTSDISDYNADKRRLNQQYGFSKPSQRTNPDSSSTLSSTRINYTQLKKSNSPIVPYVERCKQLINDKYNVYKQSIKVYNPTDCAIRFVFIGDVRTDSVSSTLESLKTEFPGDITVSYRDLPDWRLSGIDVRFVMNQPLNDNPAVDESLTEDTSSEIRYQVTADMIDMDAVYSEHTNLKDAIASAREAQQSYTNVKIKDVRDGSSWQDIDNAEADLKDGLVESTKLTLNESDDTDILYDMEDYDEDNTTVTAGNSFIEDGRTWTWFKQCGDTVHLDFDNWAVWWAYRPEVEDDYNSTAISGFFVVDTDTGFIDWGPCDTVKEAQEFLQSKVNDWENDDLDESIKVGDKVKVTTPGNNHYDGRTGVVDYTGDGIVTVKFDDNNSPKLNNFDLNQVTRIDESKSVKESYRQDTPDNVYKVGDRVAQRWTDEFNVGTVTDIKEEEGTQYKVEWDYSEGPDVEWLYGTDISLWIEEENIDESKSIKEDGLDDFGVSKSNADMLSTRLPDSKFYINDNKYVFGRDLVDYFDGDEIISYSQYINADNIRVPNSYRINGRIHTTTESIKEDVNSAASSLFDLLKDYGAISVDKDVDVTRISFRNSEDDSDATLVHHCILSKGYKELNQYGNNPNVTEYLNEAGDTCVKLLIYDNSIAVELSAEDSSQYMDVNESTSIKESSRYSWSELVDYWIAPLNLDYDSISDELPSKVVIERANSFNTRDLNKILSKIKRPELVDFGLSADQKTIWLDFSGGSVKESVDKDLTHCTECGKKLNDKGYCETEGCPNGILKEDIDPDFSDDELASIYGGDTKNDMPDGVETPEETEARLAKEAKGNEI